MRVGHRGKVLASTLKDIDDCEDSVRAFVDSPAESQVVRGYQFFKVFDDNQLEHILMAKGETDDTYMVGKIAKISDPEPSGRIQGEI